VGDSTDTRQTLKLLSGLENGSIGADDAFFVAEELDPVLVYFVTRFLRECYPASDPAARSVLERVVRLTTSHPEMVSICRQGEQDPVARWFDDEYTFREFRGRGPELVDLIVEKLES
jgi:hypothetical protein